jgi:ABC-2 type transport system ATP-binding protein
MIDAVIQVDNLEKEYHGKVRALKGATLSVARGERACLLGPNGAGKTTLIRILGGILSPTAGSATLLGTKTNSPSFKEAKRSVGIVPEAPGMYDDLTVGEYLRFVRDIYGRGSVDDIVEAFELGQYYKMTMTKLSGGYQRRVALAAAVLPDPELLLLDEPTVRLDPVAATQMRRYIKHLGRDKTFLLCTHNLAEAEELADKVIIIRDGKVLIEDSLDSLRSRLTRHAVIEAIEGDERVIATLKAGGYQVAEDHEGVRVTVTDYRHEMPEILRLLLNADVHVYSAKVEEASLEEIFLKALGVKEDE